MSTDASPDRESKKTLIYVALALAAMVIAWEPWRRASVASNVPADVGGKLFKDFTDPLKATSLEITRFDESNATIHQFAVAQNNGIWSIPSHSGYPADAREHMAQAATALLNLEILHMESDKPGDQEHYGVVSPDRSKLKQGSTGVGTRVTMKDGQDKMLADIVIGKEFKDQPAIRYVRREGRDQIYRVAIKTDKLSTKFEDWIEKDLLKLNAFDVKTVELNDYSTQEGMSPSGQLALGINQRSRTRLVYDNQNNNWILIDMSEGTPDGKLERVALAEDEELNTEKLNTMKTALDDLQIIDVERKPKGLSQDLKATEDFVKNREAVESLLERGFYPASRPGGPVEIYSSEGEATCATKDGVRYVLRFGGLAGGGLESKPEAGKNPALNRFLFITAQFDPSQIQQPTLEPVPGEENAAGETSGEADKEKEPAATPEKPAGEASETKTAAQDPAAPTQETAPAADDKPADKAQDAVAPSAPPTPEEEQRIMIRRENKRKQDEYEDALKKGEAKVKELNERFADWYYIISDDVYKKIHLGRGDIVKKKGAAEDPTKPVNELLDLEQGIR